VFEFDESVAAADIEDALEVAVAALDGLVGAAAVLLEAGHRFEPEQRRVRIATRHATGRLLARAFYEIAARSLGAGSIRHGSPGAEIGHSAPEVG
jgi:hypothetical protein